MSLIFAHLTDIHFSLRDVSWSTLGSLAEVLFAAAIEDLNSHPELDFVLITGDVLDGATEEELQRFNDVLRKLKKPWHFVPGNHDGFISPESPDAYQPHEAIPQIDSRLAHPRPDANRAWWSRTVKSGVQLIGLDSRIEDTWNGIISEAQLDWLREELANHSDKAVILAVHHPLANLMAKDSESWWSNFIVDNGKEVESVLNTHSNVLMVLNGHHHANRIQRRGSRLHVSTAALSGYPCEYRLIQLEARDGKWWAQVTLHSPADEGQRKIALDMMLDSTTANKFNPDRPADWADFAEGSPEDRSFKGELA